MKRLQIPKKGILFERQRTLFHMTLFHMFHMRFHNFHFHNFHFHNSAGGGRARGVVIVWFNKERKQKHVPDAFHGTLSEVMTAKLAYMLLSNNSQAFRKSSLKLKVVNCSSVVVVVVVVVI